MRDTNIYRTYLIMANYNSKYSGEQVEALLDQVASGNAGGGGGGITVETDPIFSNSPAATITEDKKTEWDSKYSKPSGGIPKSDLASDVQASLSNADNAVQKGMVGTLNIINVEGVYDDDYVYALPTAAAKNVDEDYDDIILSRGSVKTINGESIVGSGDITISGGSGEVGPQGPQGDKGDKGDPGVGVQSVQQTTISNTDGGSNVVTVTLTNGTKSTFTVKNGSKGSQGIQGIQGVQGIQGPKGDKGDTGANGTDGTNGDDGATFTPSVDSAGNLSWTNNKGLTNPPTVNIKGPKGDAGEGGGSGGGKEVVLISNGVIELLERNKIYIFADNSGSRTFEIQAIEEVNNTGEYAEYTVIFASEDDMEAGLPLSITLPDNVYWANGKIPDLTLNANYELSIVGWEASNNSGFNAVITPFKPV